MYNLLIQHFVHYSVLITINVLLFFLGLGLELGLRYMLGIVPFRDLSRGLGLVLVLGIGLGTGVRG